MSGATRGGSPLSVGSSGGGGVVIAQPWVANAARTAGQVVSQGGALYTALTTGTNGATFAVATDWIVGVTAGVQAYEQNGSGQVIATWKGNGTGNAATKILDVLTAGAFSALGAWSAGTAYGVSAIVNRNGSGYISLVGTTGVDPATDSGANWMLLASKGDIGPTGPTGSPTTDQSILLRHLSDLARDPTLMTGHIAQAMDRRLPTSNVVLTSGTLQFTACAVPGGRAINNITLWSGNIGVTTPTHQWFCLYDAARNKLAVTVDDTTAAWAASAGKTLALTAPYTPSAGALLYVGVLVAATTPNNLAGMGQANPVGQAPSMGGSSTAALTDPTTAPATAAAFVGKAPFWASLS